MVTLQIRLEIIFIPVKLSIATYVLYYTMPVTRDSILTSHLPSFFLNSQRVEQPIVDTVAYDTFTNNLQLSLYMCI